MKTNPGKHIGEKKGGEWKTFDAKGKVAKTKPYMTK